jgi:hypothetical protein
MTVSRRTTAVALTLAFGVVGCTEKAEPAPPATAPEPSQQGGSAEPVEDRAAPAAVPTVSPSYAPVVAQAHPTQVFWGDTHLHTSWSPDANAKGNQRLDPEAAYRFAKGQEVVAHNGMAVRLRRPLDFLVVADHSEAMAFMPKVRAKDPMLLETEFGKHTSELLEAGKGEQAFGEFLNAVNKNEDPIGDPELARSVWKEYVAFAERHNDPGRFTAFIGYEWTSNTNSDNLHRVVVFKDGADKATQVIPFTAFDSDEPEPLWEYLSNYEKTTGGEVLAIPHNPNVSVGKMFALEDSKGKPLTRAYAETRAMWEPLLEATQYKGDSETHPFLSPDDEFADYETWDKGNLLLLTKHEDWMYPFEYARSALRNGLALEQKLGANPFKFGMIGSTDAHTSLATASEDSFWGKTTGGEPSAERWSEKLLPENLEGRKGQIQEWEMAASGYAGVWATANTREAIFDAMRRKETYATTGPRMTVRFFGGWDYAQSDALSASFAEIGYSKGVPMGGDLSRGPAGKSPVFLIRAVKDAGRANLDRVQVIKGWVDEAGKTHERIYDVAVTGGRKIGKDGRCRTPVGNTVDVANATYENTIGAAELAATWKDPDFDPSRRAFYYVRVIEIPKPRWTAYDAKFFDVKMDDEVPMTTQDRAYTSPIWYTP